MKKTQVFDFATITESDEEPETVEPKEKKVDVWAYTKAIMQTKEELDVEAPDANYVPFLVNKALSLHADTIILAQEMNRRHTMSKKHQFMFLMATVRACKRRWRPWPKKETNLDDVKVLAEYYGFSRRKAVEALEFLTDEQINLIKKRLDKGTV